MKKLIRTAAFTFVLFTIVTALHAQDSTWFDFGGYIRSGYGVDGQGNPLDVFKAPNSEAKWSSLISLPDAFWQKIWKSIGTELTSPKDENSWMKLLHRGLSTRGLLTRAQPLASAASAAEARKNLCFTCLGANT